MSAPEPPPEPPAPSEPLESSAPFLPSEPATPAAPPAPRGPRFGEAWPFFAAGVLVAVTLAIVFALLHPRRSGPAGGEEGVPASVTAEETSLRREPSVRAAAMASLSRGNRVRVRAETAPWVEVASDAGTGYLPANAIERDADREARERRTKTLLALPPVYGVVAEDAEVALAPYPIAARGGSLAKGTVIAIHSVDHSYFAFADKTWGIAFVDSSRVDLVPPDPREPAIAPEKVRPLKNLTVIDLSAEPPPEEEGSAEGQELSKPPVLPPPGVPSEPAPGLLESPVVVSRTEPSYPEVARRAGVEGTVELEVSIDASGKVTDVEVVRGLPLGLSEAASDAVRRWTWKPARAASGPVASRKTVRIRFLLHPEEQR